MIKFLGITDYINGIEPKSLLLLAAWKKIFLAKNWKADCCTFCIVLEMKLFYLFIYFYIVIFSIFHAEVLGKAAFKR